MKDTDILGDKWLLSHSLQLRHNGRNSVSNHQPHDCLLNRLFRRRSKKTSKLRVTGFCAGNSPGTGEFPAQMASNADNVSIWWRHHDQHQPYSPSCDYSVTLIPARNMYVFHFTTIKQTVFERGHDMGNPFVSSFSVDCFFTKIIAV